MADQKPKYQHILEKLTLEIRTGKFAPGARLPSEAALVKRFAASRITVGRALRELKHEGLIERVAGSGSFVRTAGRPDTSHIFGLLIPDLGETEIFDAICQGIASAQASINHALLWGHADRSRSSKEAQALDLCRQFIARRVSGVFFAPLEFEPTADRTNRKILAMLSEAALPVVLLDRRNVSKPGKARPDLVGLNNRHAGYLATEHLIQLGCRRIGFLGYHGAAATITTRLQGYEDALREYGLPVDQPLQASKGRDLEAYVCVNDRVAGQLMHSLLATGLHIPGDIRLVGIDDVSFASLLPVPLTSVRQPCHEIGAAALAAMLARIEHPHAPARDILLDGTLVVRASSGIAMDR
jgi:DNA-binding LacI/PurR family transcriptional regulator